MTIAENLIEKGVAKGLRLGIEQGIEKGIEKGKAEERALLAKKMLSKGKSLEEITDLTGLSVLEVEKLRQEVRSVIH